MQKMLIFSFSCKYNFYAYFDRIMFNTLFHIQCTYYAENYAGKIGAGVLKNKVWSPTPMDSSG